ncbi:MAG: NnrS family protein [Thiobacillus sp.]
MRVAVPLFFPASHAAAMTASGLLWMVGFGLFVALYAPVLLRPRVDGKPG